MSIRYYLMVDVCWQYVVHLRPPYCKVLSKNTTEIVECRVNPGRGINHVSLMGNDFTSHRFTGLISSFSTGKSSTEHLHYLCHHRVAEVLNQLQKGNSKILYVKTKLLGVNMISVTQPITTFIDTGNPEPLTTFGFSHG
ncbi:ORF 5a [Beluga whale coronavirus SW1]|uniref:ORF 5a n=1 Tax=Beluga whale coronavirus (strain SW1) TaxID=694015 RepID=B2BW36_BWCOV|nr:ORF 5a [Beluga whale coronavirus SW1]ABW87823.1 ORF 5a [Beluga whale coronavirus SW1]